MAAVHPQVVNVLDGDPLDAGCLSAGGRLTGDVLSSVDHAERLPDLVIAGVVNDVSRVGEDTDVMAERQAVRRLQGAVLHRPRTAGPGWDRISTQSGLSKSTVGRIWRAFGLKPHLVDTFKLCVDEKSGIQAQTKGFGLAFKCSIQDSMWCSSAVMLSSDPVVHREGP